jgi:hypothetical protein
MGARTWLKNVEKRKFLTIPGLELRFHGRPTRRQSLNQLHTPASELIQEQAITMRIKRKQTPWPLVRYRTIPTDRPPLVDEI